MGLVSNEQSGCFWAKEKMLEVDREFLLMSLKSPTLSFSSFNCIMSPKHLSTPLLLSDSYIPPF